VRYPCTYVEERCRVRCAERPLLKPLDIKLISQVVCSSRQIVSTRVFGVLYGGTSFRTNSLPIGPYSRTMPRALRWP